MPSASYSGGSSGSGSSTIPTGNAVSGGVKWEDATAPVTPKMAVPSDPGLKLQCSKRDNGTYTCRKGQYTCGWGCLSDGSNCAHGYCLQSDCDNVMGQKWNLVQAQGMFVCQHPDYPVRCYPDSWNGSIDCRSGRNFDRCGYTCNKNGTQCESGPNNCWDAYR